MRTWGRDCRATCFEAEMLIMFSLQNCSVGLFSVLFGYFFCLICIFWLVWFDFFFLSGWFCLGIGWGFVDFFLFGLGFFVYLFLTCFIFSITAAVFRELYFVMKNMDVSNGVVCPNHCAWRPDKWEHSHLYTWQWNLFLPSKFTRHEMLMGWILFPPLATYAKQYLGCIFYRQLGKDKPKHKPLPTNTGSTAHYRQSLVWGTHLPFPLALGTACKRQPSIPSMGKVGPAKSPLVHSPPWSGVSPQSVSIRSWEIGDRCII